MKYIKNKIFIVSLTLALSAVVMFSVFYFMGIGNLPASAVQAALAPFQKMFTAVGESIQGYSIYFSNMKALYEENQALKERIEQLERDRHEAELAVGENEALRDYLGIRDRYESFSAVGAQVLGRSDGTYLQYITLDKGSASGIKENIHQVFKRYRVLLRSEGMIGNWLKIKLMRCRWIVRLVSHVGNQ